MKKAFCVMSFCAALARCALSQWVYSDGTNVLSAPRAMPSQGISRATGGVVVGLYSLPAERRAECGWYEAAKEDIGKTEGYICVSNSWSVSGHTATLRSWWAPAPFESWEISKYRLCRIVEEYGRLEELISLIGSDPSVKFMWDAAVTLNRTNEFVTAFEREASLNLKIPMDVISNILWEARAR